MKQRFVIAVLVALLASGCAHVGKPAVEAGPKPEEHQPATVEFAIVGDIMVHKPQIDAAYFNDCSCYRFDGVFQKVKKHLQADITIGNLETTLPGKPDSFSGYPRFGAPDSLVMALKNAGFKLLVTANNHAMDKGRQGLVRTLKTLDKYGLAHLGTSAGTKEKPFLIMKKNGLRLAFLNYTYGTNMIAVPFGLRVNMIDRKTIARHIRMARAHKPDAIIVLPHFGKEYLRHPDGFQKELVKFLFHEGADIVLGSHPHVVQPFKTVTAKDRYGVSKTRFVIYSLGNFVSNQQRRYTDGGIILKFVLEKKRTVAIKNIRYVPVWVHVSEFTGQSRYEILPAQEYMQPKLFGGLPNKARKNLKIFYKDITAHLQASE